MDIYCYSRLIMESWRRDAHYKTGGRDKDAACLVEHL